MLTLATIRRIIRLPTLEPEQTAPFRMYKPFVKNFVANEKKLTSLTKGRVENVVVKCLYVELYIQYAKVSSLRRKGQKIPNCRVVPFGPVLLSSIRALSTTTVSI